MLAVIAVVVLCVPFAVFTVINHEVAASSWAVLAGVTALANYVLGGPAFGYLSVGLLTALTPLAIVSGSVPLAGAGLMAIMCYGVGVSAARGLNRDAADSAVPGLDDHRPTTVEHHPGGP